MYKDTRNLLNLQEKLINFLDCFISRFPEKPIITVLVGISIDHCFLLEVKAIDKNNKNNASSSMMLEFA